MSFVLPSGRLLLAVGLASGPTTGFDSLPQYRWLTLPDMTVTPHQLLINEYPTSFTLWNLSPDLAHLAIARYTWSKTEIGGQQVEVDVSGSVLIADPDGNQATPIRLPIDKPGQVHRVSYEQGPVWSANSQVVGFALTPDWDSVEKEHHLYVYEVASGKLRAVTIHSQQDLAAFALSPDGAQIAVTERETTPEYALNLHLMNADGSNDRVLVKGWVNSSLVWRLDGTRIFFKSDRPEAGIYSVDVATGATSLITPVSEQAEILGLLPDESLLTYDDVPGGIMLVNPDGGTPQQLPGVCNGRDVSRNRSGALWSPDSRYFAFVTEDQLYIMDRTGNCKALDYQEDNIVPWYPIAWLP
jgi:dipeptidyl aminopeptidase/acylaminoacyl peptidase